MGNCMETCMKWQVAELQLQEEEEEERAGGFGVESGMKIKVVLTKEEVEWLIVELKSNGKRSLEDVLAQLERKRGSFIEQKWKPSLESIVEGPELHEMDRSLSF